MNKTMEQNDKQLDDLRLQWQAMKIDNQRLEDTNRRLTQSLAAEKAESRQRKLALRYRISGILAIVLLPVLALQIYYDSIAPLWMAWLYGVVGCIMGILDLSFSFYISKDDYLQLPTCEAVRRASKVILWQARLLNLGFVLAFIVLVPLMAHFAFHSAAMVVGGLIGLVLGLTIGLSIYQRNRRLARRMLSDLEG